jgi:hypothetical protein
MMYAMPLVRRPCSTCQTEVLRPQYRAGLPHAFCSKQCETTWRLQYGPRGNSHVQHVPPVVLSCEACAQTIHKIPSKVRDHNFCGVACRELWQRTSDYMAAEKSATWRGGHHDYRGPNWTRQRQAALLRDKHCLDCGTTRRLQVHHVRPWVTFDRYQDANELANLRTLCMNCHGKAEWAYWAAHPDQVHLCPDTRRIHHCRKCGSAYLALSPRSLDCDACCSNRSSRRLRAIRAGHRPSLAVPQ